MFGEKVLFCHAHGVFKLHALCKALQIWRFKSSAILCCIIWVKFANQAKNIYKYKNIKAKLPNCNANRHFNQQWMKKGLMPNQVKLKVPNMTPAIKFTQGKTKPLK